MGEAERRATDERKHADEIEKLKTTNEALKSNLAGTEEACEGMQRELERIQKEYNDLAQTLSGTLDTTGEEEEEEY